MKLFYRRIGTGEPILILHGLFGSSDNWMTIATGLKDLGRIYLLDLRNHGRSPHSDLFNYSTMSEDVYEFLGDLNIRRITLIGHSMGGVIAMNFALIYPHRVQKLVVIDIAPRKYFIHYQNIVDGLLAIDIDKVKTRQEADDQLSVFVEQETVRQFLLKNLYRTTDGKYTWRLNLKIIAQNLANLGTGIQSNQSFLNPCLFIRGTLSDYIRDEDEPQIKKLFPSAEILTVKNTTHWLPAEEPEVIRSLIRTFLNQNKSLH